MKQASCLLDEESAGTTGQARPTSSAVQHDRPLADQLRPRQFKELVGQAHLLAAGMPLHNLVHTRRLHSMVLWGPPGCGKTTIARVLGHACGAAFIPLASAFAGVKDIRNAVDQARRQACKRQKTLLFVDEVHRFNKAQQDAFLPYVEDGTFVFIGATTENPAFQLNNALLSRLSVYVLKPLSGKELLVLIERACSQHAGLKRLRIEATVKDQLARMADGDARKALNLLELCMHLARDGVIDRSVLERAGTHKLHRFDHHGDIFYDQISALHKAVRGSDPDAAVYWFARMIDGGCDPRYIARRLLRMAYEDVGHADTSAMSAALTAWDSYERLGSPEGELALAQAAVYLACAPKSNAVYMAYNRASEAVKQHGTLEVPLHLRNAPTRLARSLEHGRGYRYAHDHPDAFVPGETYLPRPLIGSLFYQPSKRGQERAIAERLSQLRALNGKFTKRKKENGPN